MNSRRLAQTLIQQGLLNQEQIEEAIQRQVVQGGSLGTNLLELGMVAEEQLLAATGEASGLSVAGRSDIDAIAAHIPRIFPLPFAEAYHIVPKNLTDQVLEVIVSGQPDDKLFERIRERFLLELEPRVTSEVRMHYAMNRLYGAELLPRYRSILNQIDGETSSEPSIDPSGKVLSWGVSGKRIRPSRTRGSAKVGLDMRGILSRVDSAVDRDTVVEILLGATVAIFEFGGLFLVQGEHVNGWRGTDPESTQRLSRISLPVELPSVFQTIYATGGHYLGPLPTNSTNQRLLQDLGREPPRAALVAPISVGDKLAAILYADNGSRTISTRRVAAMLVLVQRVGLAFRRLIRRRHEAAARMLESSTEAVAVSAPPAGDEQIVELDGDEFQVITDEDIDLGTQSPEPSPPPPPADASPPPVPTAESSSPEVAPEEPPREEDSWESVTFADVDTSPEAATEAFTRGANQTDTAIEEDDEDDGYVAFSDVADGAEESLGEWRDVLDDAAIAAEASTGSAPTTTRAVAPPTVTWDDVIREARSASQHVPQQMTDIEVAGTTINRVDIMFDGLEASDPSTRTDAVQSLVELGATIDAEITQRFPGHFDFDPLDAQTRLPPFAKCNGLMELLATRGQSVAPLVLPHLESQEPAARFFAIYYLLSVPYADAVEPLARRLYDTEPRIRYLAVDALRRYAGEPAYRRVVDGIRGQLRVPVLESQVAAVQVLGQLRDPSAVPNLIPLVVSPQAALSSAAVSSLSTLCAQDFATDVRQWSEWWQQNYSRPRPLWLLSGLRHENAAVRRLANSELQVLTGRTANFDADAPVAEREAAARLWQAWWEQTSGAASSPQAAPASQ